MTTETRWRYEQRIKALEADVERLAPYKTLAENIFVTLCDLISESKQVSMGWLLKQFRHLLK